MISAFSVALLPPIDQEHNARGKLSQWKANYSGTKPSGKQMRFSIFSRFPKKINV
jgi:hypothetical protein